MPKQQTPPREAKLFRNNKIEPIRRKNLLEVLAELKLLEPHDEFPDIDDDLPPVD